MTNTMKYTISRNIVDNMSRLTAIERQLDEHLLRALGKDAAEMINHARLIERERVVEEIKMDCIHLRRILDDE